MLPISTIFFQTDNFQALLMSYFNQRPIAGKQAELYLFPSSWFKAPLSSWISKASQIILFSHFVERKNIVVSENWIGN